MAGREPSQITLTVFSARDLQGKRRGESCQASVVFGLGKSQYITEVIDSNRPEWNQEAVISVPARSQTQTVKFKVRDKDHVLGVVLLSLTSLGSHREASKKWLPLSPHKKGHEAFGELLVECFVSQYRPGHVVSLSEASSPVLSRMGSQEDMLNPGFKKGRRFSLHRRTPSWTKGSAGNADASSSSGRSKLTDLGSDASSLTKQVSAETTPSLHSESSVLDLPEVTGISPREGLVQGGERVVLRGTNLGESKSSIVRVVLGDVDCTSTLEYISQNKVAVTTLPRHAPSRGHVLVETINGGVGISSVEFAFVEREVAAPPEVSGVSPREGPLAGGQKVILRGNNLGECKEDVVRVVIADVDCTESLEYFSPAKLVVTILPRPSPGSGEVLVETVRGGTSTTSLTFTYVVGEPPVTEQAHSRTHSSGGSKKSQQHEVDQAEIKLLRQQIKDLRDDNLHLRERNHALMGYIDTLLLSIIESKPDILEVKPFQSNHSNTVNSSVTV